MTTSPLASALLERALSAAASSLGPRAAVVLFDEPLAPRLVAAIAPEMAVLCGAASSAARSARGSLAALPVAGQAVTGVLVHLPPAGADAARAVREIERALQPDGRALVSLVGGREEFLRWRDAFRAASFPVARVVPAAAASASSRLPLFLVASWQRFRASAPREGDVVAGLVAADLAADGSGVPGSGEVMRSLFLPRFPRK